MSTGDCSAGGALVIGALATGSAIAVGNVLSKAISDVYEYSCSLRDTSADPYDDHQPRVHHVIPKGEFSNRSDETKRQLREMHELLISVEIDLNDPENLIVMSHGTHKSFHDDDYIAAVYQIMMTSRYGDEWDVRTALFFARTYASSYDRYPNGY